MCNPPFHEFVAQLLHTCINTYKNVISIRNRIQFYHTVVHWHTGLHKSHVITRYLCQILMHLPNLLHSHTNICIGSLRKRPWHNGFQDPRSHL